MATVDKEYLTSFEDWLRRNTSSPVYSPIPKRRSNSPMAEAGNKIKSLVGNFNNAKYRLSIRLKKESGQPERIRQFPFSDLSRGKDLPTYNDVLLDQIQQKYENELDKPRSNSEPDSKLVFPPKEMLPQFLSTLPEESSRQASLSPEEKMSAYLSALQSTLCLLRAGLSRTDADTLLGNLQEVFDVQDEEQDTMLNHIIQQAHFYDNIECRVIGVGYLAEKYQSSSMYCRVGISYIDPVSISPKTHITELINEENWESTSSINPIRDGARWDETKTLPISEGTRHFFIELWSGSEFALPSQARGGHSPRLIREKERTSIFNPPNTPNPSNPYSQLTDSSSMVAPAQWRNQSPPSIVHDDYSTLPLPIPSRPPAARREEIPMIMGCIPINLSRIPLLSNFRRAPSPRFKNSGDVFIGRMYMDAEKITTECAGGAVQSYPLFSRSGKHMRGTIQLQLRLVSRCVVPGGDDLPTLGAGHIPQVPTPDINLPICMEPLQLHRNVLLALAKYEIENNNGRDWDGCFDSYFNSLLKQHTFDHELSEVQSSVANLDVVSKIQPSLYCRAATLESHFYRLLTLFGESGAGLGGGEKKLLRRTLEGLMDYHLHALAVNMFFVVHTERETSQKVIEEVHNLLEVIYKLMKELSIYHYETETKFRLEQKVMHLVTICFDSCLEKYSVTSFGFIVLVEAIRDYLRKIRDYQTTYDVETDCMRHLYKCIIMHLAECIKKFMMGDAVSRATELTTIRTEVRSLYVVIRHIQELRPSFTIINSEDGQNNEILQPFESYIIPWYGDECSKNCDIIREAIEVDKLSPIDIHVKYSSMVTDIEGVLTETYTFLRLFQWARPSAFSKLIERVLHYLHRLVDIFVIQSKERLNRVESEYPYLTIEEIIILNNTSNMHEIVDSAKEKISKISRVSESSKIIIDEGIKDIHERLHAYTETLIQNIAKMFTADSKELLKEILKLPKDNSLIQPVNNWTSFIYTLTERVLNSSSSTVLKLLFTMMWDSILDTIVRQLDKKGFKVKGKLSDRLESIMPMMYSSFNKEGKGLQAEELKSENYANIIYKILKH